MTREEIVSKAKYIQFPYMNKVYKDLYDSREVVRIPLASGYDPLYSMSVNDKHHYTTKYHMENVLPLLESMYCFEYSPSDFNIVKHIVKEGEYSYMSPKKNMKFDSYLYDQKCGTDIQHDISFDDLHGPQLNGSVEARRYWGLYKYAHRCSRIINKSLPQTGRRLFISGDSQIIPDIPVLACYFREVWYFDNRTGYITGPRDEKGNYTISWDKDKHIKCEKFYKEKNFTDVLIQLYTSGLERYEKWNLY